MELFGILAGIVVTLYICYYFLKAKDNRAGLTRCKYCKKDISRRAKSCPHCGAPASSNSHSGCLTLIGILCVLYFLGAASHGNKSTRPPKPKPPKINFLDRDDHIYASIMIQEFVKERLKSPTTARFPKELPRITVMGNQVYQTLSYVDSQNGFGAIVRTRYSCTIKQAAKDKWKLTQLNFY